MRIGQGAKLIPLFAALVVAAIPLVAACGSSEEPPTPTATPVPTVTYFRTGGEPSGLAFDGEHIWIANAADNTVTRMRRDGGVLGIFDVGERPVAVAYGGGAARFGPADDPMVGRRVGGVNVVGGGFGLYNAEGELIGAIGVSGDSSCADHNIAWRTRHLLELDYVPAGVSGDAQRPDNIVFDIGPAGSAGGFGHPHCGSDAQNESNIAGALPPVRTKA